MSDVWSVFKCVCSKCPKVYIYLTECHVCLYCTPRDAPRNQKPLDLPTYCDHLFLQFTIAHTLTHHRDHFQVLYILAHPFTNRLIYAQNQCRCIYHLKHDTDNALKCCDTAYTTLLQMSLCVFWEHFFFTWPNTGFSRCFCIHEAAVCTVAVLSEGYIPFS